MIHCAAMDDRYEIGARLGRGGMGNVYLGKRRLANGHQQPVVFKCMHDAIAGHTEAIERFDREAMIGLRLSHENIVEVYDYLECDGKRWIVMEYVNGLPLCELTEWNVLSHGVIRMMLADVLRALSYLHGFNIIHRDISPNNILISRFGDVKLLDMGVVKRLDGAATEGGFKGKAAYASPEALAEQDLDVTSDLYSVAAVFFEVLAHEPPYGHGTREAIRERQEQGKRTPWPEEAHVPPDLRTLLEPLLLPRDERVIFTADDVLGVLYDLWKTHECALADARELRDSVRQAMIVLDRRRLLGASKEPVQAAAPADGAARPVKNSSYARGIVQRSKRTPWLVAVVAVIALVALIASVMQSKDGEHASLPDQEEKRNLPTMSEFTQ